MLTDMKSIKTATSKRGFFTRLLNAITPTRVYVARKIVPPYVPSGMVCERGATTASNAIVGSGKFDHLI